MDSTQEAAIDTFMLGDFIVKPDDVVVITTDHPREQSIRLIVGRHVYTVRRMVKIVADKDRYYMILPVKNVWIDGRPSDAEAILLDEASPKLILGYSSKEEKVGYRSAGISHERGIFEIKVEQPTSVAQSE